MDALYFNVIKSSSGTQARCSLDLTIDNYNVDFRAKVKGLIYSVKFYIWIAIVWLNFTVNIHHTYVNCVTLCELLFLCIMNCSLRCIHVFFRSIDFQVLFYKKKCSSVTPGFPIWLLLSGNSYFHIGTFETV